MLGERLTAIAFAVAALVPLPSSPVRLEVGYRAGAAPQVQQLEARLGLTRVATIPQLRIDVVEVDLADDDAVLARLPAAPAVEWTAPDTRVNPIRAPKHQT
jgi:hypothetical protein